MRCLIALWLLAGLTLGSEVRACDDLATARLDSSCVVLPYGAQRGVWFRDDAAEDLHRLVLVGRQDAVRADAAEALAVLRYEQYEQARHAADLLTTARLEDSRAIAAYRQQVEADAARSRSVLHSPWLWATVGAAVGGFAGCALGGQDVRVCGLLAGGGGAAGLVLVFALH